MRRASSLQVLVGIAPHKGHTVDCRIGHMRTKSSVERATRIAQEARFCRLMKKPSVRSITSTLTALSVLLFSVGIIDGGHGFRYEPAAIYFVAAGLLSVGSLYLRLLPQARAEANAQWSQMLSSA